MRSTFFMSTGAAAAISFAEEAMLADFSLTESLATERTVLN